jgi:hypothetical protein
MARILSKQSHRANQPHETIQDYFKKSIFIPYLDSVIESLMEKFSETNQTAFEVFKLHPKILLCTIVQA